jgi:hypothetical protein
VSDVGGGLDVAVGVGEGSRQVGDGSVDGTVEGTGVGAAGGEMSGIGPGSGQPAPPMNWPRVHSEGTSTSLAKVPIPRQRAPPRSAMSRAYSVLDAPRERGCLTSRRYLPKCDRRALPASGERSKPHGPYVAVFKE